MAAREFRTSESYKAERETRGMISTFLRTRGFRNVSDKRTPIGITQSQTIEATNPVGEVIKIRVKLCWRRRDQVRRFAVQLVAKITNNEWEPTLHRFVERAHRDGCTHFLFIQREDSGITAAALVPVRDLVAIWCAQRDISTALIAEGTLGRRKKNHAMNGSSPTLWLEDDMAQPVTNALWQHESVLNLAEMNVIPIISKIENEDTFDETSGVDYTLLGSDGAEKLISKVSNIKRDQRVRLEVLKRANGKCEECGTSRDYSGFLDVHHILRAENSDRVWNCVAICPNCHRGAHAAPDREAINARLLRLANKSSNEGIAAHN